MNRKGRTATRRSTGGRLPSATPRAVSAGTTNYSDGDRGPAGGTVNVLAGTGNHASSDAPFGIQGGYIFDAVLKAGGTVRNYGFLVNNIGSIGTIAAPISDPFTAGVVQVGAARPVAGAADRRVLPRLRPELSGPVAVQRVEARVRSVRHQRKPARPVAGALQPRPHGQLRHGAGGREHPRDPASRRRSRGRAPGRDGGEQPLRRRHPHHRDRGRLPGRPRPRRLAPRDRPTSSVRTSNRGRSSAPATARSMPCAPSRTSSGPSTST